PVGGGSAQRWGGESAGDSLPIEFTLFQRFLRVRPAGVQQGARSVRSPRGAHRRGWASRLSLLPLWAPPPPSLSTPGRALWLGERLRPRTRCCAPFSRVRFRANRTLNRHRRMPEFDPKLTLAIARYGTYPGTQSGLTPADLTTFAHFSVSSSMSLPKSAGELASAVAPKSESFVLILGSTSAALISLLSLSMISTGVFLGAPTPRILLAS